jgi:hypothetical protein
MTCPDCSTAAVQQWHGFAAGCKGCVARAVARGPNFHASRVQGSLTRPYLDELLRTGLTHEEVRKAQEVDAT